WGPDEHELDFRVGGREISRGGPKGGPVHTFNALYQDIVPNERIILTYDMHLDDTRISVSLTSVELKPAGVGTRLISPGQGVDLERYILDSQTSVDTFLFGRVTYEGMAAYWPSAEGEIADFMNWVPKVVFSRTLERADWNNTRLVKGSVPEEISRLKQQPGGDI